MKIIKKKNEEVIPFGDLYEGTVFATSDRPETFYMKTEFVANEDEEFNCVNLEDGALEYFSSDDEVIPVNATLNILD